MKLKHQVLVYNFLGYAILFILLRFVLHFTLKLDSIYLALIAAIAASVLAPKFAVVKKEGVDKMVMKWIFIKGFKEL
ncbi:hypothetical protein [Maribacter hydrothermalis]|uniref:Uncharacterized protein n=1 Tax=Maribacter hydrothermalis TaxID=1836467 RepID=A0A1B7ZDI5_9FLAO|nr:hypothetical protein [Maribacter hydrothermalis]APQ18393.1 hypothetical protein BTR34_14185 [Maribacter hydrothermalis]OBR41400.1 hypothetical protein A9200_13910 [Maribacter hydrothermalis]